MTSCRDLTACLACGRTTLAPVLDLGQQPLANTYATTPEEARSLPRYPLVLMRCVHCTHLQLSVSVDRAAIFSDYIYRSGTADTMREHFRTFAQYVTDRHGVGRVLDIACNDGSQLDAFRDLGWQTVGVDPAVNLREFNTHETRWQFFDESCLDLGDFDVVVAQNVVAHTDRPANMLSLAGRMSDHVYVQTSQARMIHRGEFDTIYHEHLSFFSPRSMAALAMRSSMFLQDVRVVPIHGESFVFHLGHTPTEPSLEYWGAEQVERFAGNARTVISDLREMFDRHPSLVGYGAAAKAMTVLNAVGAGPRFIVDDAPEKQGRYTPGLGIGVWPPDELCWHSERDDGPLELVPLAWNFHDEIVQRVRRYYTGPMRTLRYFPEVRWA